MIIALVLLTVSVVIAVFAVALWFDAAEPDDGR
jgi:hypothetical protein